MVILLGKNKHDGVIKECENVRLMGEFIEVDGERHYQMDYNEIAIFTPGGVIPLKVPQEQKVQRPSLVVPKLN